MALAYLLDPCLQHQNRAGVNNVDGWFEVYLDSTDDHATVYSDFNGTLCPERIGIDNNGRAVMIVDSSNAYRVEMHDRTGNLIYTQHPVWTQKSGGGVTGVKVESTDGTVNVQKTTAGGITIYDLSTQVTEEASSWGGIVMRGTGVEGDGMWHPVLVDSTQGSVPYSNGWTVAKDCVADIAAALEFSCNDSTALHIIDVQCEFVRNNAVERTEGGMIDPTQPKGRVCFEYKGSVSEGDKIDCRIYVRCSQDVTLFLGGYAVYNEEVDGVVGGGSGGGIEQIQSDWTQTNDQAVDFIKHKPENLVQDASYVHTDNNFTDSDKSKLDGIESGAEVNVQANWTEADSSADSYIKNKPQNLVQDANYVHTDNNFTDADKSKLGGIESGAEVNVQANWNETNSSSDSYIQNKPQNLVQDASYVHTDNNFTNADKSKLDGIESGAEANVQANWNETNSSSDSYIQNKPDLSQYATTTDLADKADKVASATNGHLAGLDSNGNLTDSGIAASDVATQSDLIGKQDTLTTGPNIDIINNVISTEKTVVAAGQNVSVSSSLDSLTRTVTYTVNASGAAAQIQSDWTQTNDQSVDYIKNKPDLSQYATTTDVSGKADKVVGATNGHLAGLDSSGNLTDSGIAATDVATQSDLSGKQDTLTPGSNVTITNNVISATDTNTHRPIQLGGSQILGDNTDPLNFVAGSNVTITNSNGSLTIAASGGTFTQEQSDWDQTDNTAVDYIKNKPTIPTVPTMKELVAGNNITLTEGANDVTVACSVTVGTVVV